MDLVLDFKRIPAVPLPSVAAYIRHLWNVSASTVALSTYPRMVDMLDEIVETEFHPPKIDFIGQYVPAKTHLRELKAKSKRLFEVVNKALHKARMERTKEVQTGSLRLSTDQMTRLVRAYEQSDFVFMLMEAVATDLERTV